MKTIAILAWKRLLYYRTRTILTTVAIALSTALLIGIGTAGMGMMDMNIQMEREQGSMYHAMLRFKDAQLISQLQYQENLEAFTLSEHVADVENSDFSISLTSSTSVVGNLQTMRYAEGRAPAAFEEIALPQGLLKELGDDLKIGDTISLPYRILGRGKVITSEFRITGILESSSKNLEGISQARLSYAAIVSKEFGDFYLNGKLRAFYGIIQVKGEDQLNYDQIKEEILRIANNLSIEEEDVAINAQYLLAVTDPGQEMIIVVLFCGTLIAVFAALVFYSISYVSVVSNIQEMGKLRALGASSRQIRWLLRLESGILLIPGFLMGLLLGYAAVRIGLQQMAKAINLHQMPSLLNPAYVLAVLLLVILILWIAIWKPARIASKATPTEAVGYQEKQVSDKAFRSGYENLNVMRLSKANLKRHHKRTIMTMLTLGAGCIMFLAVAGPISSMDVTAYAREMIPAGEFLIQMEFRQEDETYPERVLNEIQRNNPLGKELANKLEAIPGVERVRLLPKVLIDLDYPKSGWMDEPRTTLAAFSKEDLPQLEQNFKRGDLDYEKMVKENGIIYTYDNAMEAENMEIGDTFTMNLLIGRKTVPLQVKLMASTYLAGHGTFLIPEEILLSYASEEELASAASIYTEPKQYDSVKAQITAMLEQDQRYTMYAMDEEEKIANLVIQGVRYPAYLIFGILAAVGLMNYMNTMLTSVLTRKKELGLMQAVGMSNRQLFTMLLREGFVYTITALAGGLTIGNALGYLIFLYAKNKDFVSFEVYHYPLTETLIMVGVIVLIQLLVTWYLNHNIQKVSLIERIREIG